MSDKLSAVQKAKKFLFKKLAIPRVKDIYTLENSIHDLDGSISYSDQSEERFDIPMEFGRRANVAVPAYSYAIKHLISCFKNIKEAVLDLKTNPKNPKTKISEEDFEELQNFVQTLNMSGMGFTSVPRELIFKDKAILYENAIVLMMNMDNSAINTSPSRKSSKNIWYTYDKLSVASNKIARFLRSKGYGTHASPPLGGIALYPMLAQKAGLGEIGYSGLLITPTNGPTVRLAAVYTTIDNFPIIEYNNHRWIREYCEQCKRCIKSCPPGAIYAQPIEHETGRVTHIDSEKCFPYFSNNFACSICIKVCPFNRLDYYTIKRTFQVNKNRQ